MVIVYLDCCFFVGWLAGFDWLLFDFVCLFCGCFVSVLIRVFVVLCFDFVWFG